jgi:hypothetical protein
MTLWNRILFIFLLTIASRLAVAQKNIYKIIISTNSLPGNINFKQIKKLSEPLKAICAFYSAMGGSYCSGHSCELTTALGLGKQGSNAHKKLIQKYFPNDKVAKAVIEQDCYLRPSGASSFSEYGYLTLSVIKDTVKVYYSLSYYNRGESSTTKGPDIYVLENNTFKMLKRNLWSWVDKKG